MIILPVLKITLHVWLTGRGNQPADIESQALGLHIQNLTGTRVAYAKPHMLMVQERSAKFFYM